MSRFIPWMLAVALCSVGCGKNGEDSGEPADGGQQTTAPGENGADAKNATDAAPFEKVIARSSMAGRWMLVLSQRGADQALALFEVTEADDNSYSANLIDFDTRLPGAKLSSSNVTTTSVNLGFDVDDRKFDFDGQLADGVVFGTLLFEDGRCDPARLIATEDKKLDSFSRPKKTGNVDAFVAAFSDEKPLEALQRFALDHPQSPLSLEAYISPGPQNQIFKLALNEKIDAAGVEELAAAYFESAKRWGPRMEAIARRDVGFVLTDSRSMPDLALKYLQQAEDRMEGQFAEDWKPRIVRARFKARVQKALEKFAGGTEREKKQAEQTLRELEKTDSFNHRILHALAGHAEKQGQLDEAIALYAKLTALPTMQQMVLDEFVRSGTEPTLPGEVLDRLWKEKHGNTDHLAEYLTKTYTESIYSFADERLKPRPPDGANRVTLCELFTGAQCGPCMAADVAIGGLEVTYAKSELIVLRYHQHGGGPDPLTNGDTEARLDYYGPLGTPTTYLNGKKLDGVGGQVLENVVPVFNRLREQIDPLLTESTDLTLKLTATAKDGILSISADVEGFEEISGRLRLRLVLAEDEVHLTATNGIRLHEMLVRGMPGGTAGVAPQDDRLRYSEQINLAHFKQNLKDYLTTYEEHRAQVFREKPLELTKMHLVAFVQNDDTKEVLQAAAIPVSGKLEYPVEAIPAPKPETKDEKKPDASDKPPAKGPKLTPPTTTPPKKADNKQPKKPDPKSRVE